MESQEIGLVSFSKTANLAEKIIASDGDAVDLNRSYLNRFQFWLKFIIVEAIAL